MQLLEKLSDENEELQLQVGLLEGQAGGLEAQLKAAEVPH